ncbi:MAG TPA: hypothetical protein VFO69_08495 [Allosphingosinicella sp.]|nr:hypothetical protein [Allosphingosinicella sp.]
MFFSFVTVIAAAASMQADPVNSARRAYTDCLQAYMRAQLEQRTEPAAFEAALASQCSDRAAAFTSAVVQRDSRADGRARAEENAHMQMEDIRATKIEYYADYHSTNTMPPN